jgi:Response regulator containing CheY-like receiver domain and AraC-type DNA-binding domain
MKGGDAVYRAMIIDDDRWALEDMRKSFDFAHYGFSQVDAFSNAEDALDAILKLEPPDLIVSDICMEKMNGLEMIRACRAASVKTIFVLVSGYSDFAYIQEAFRHQVFYYMLKPIDDRSAREVMERVCQHLQTQEKEPASYGNDTFGQILQYVRENYQENDSVESIASRFFIHKNYLSELFSKRTGMTLIQYKHLMRIQQAKRMIDGGYTNMLEIALAIGYDSASYFSRVFKRIAGVSPQQYHQSRYRRG